MHAKLRPSERTMKPGLCLPADAGYPSPLTLTTAQHNCFALGPSLLKLLRTYLNTHFTHSIPVRVQQNARRSVAACCRSRPAVLGEILPQIHIMHHLWASAVACTPQQACATAVLLAPLGMPIIAPGEAFIPLNRSRKQRYGSAVSAQSERSDSLALAPNFVYVTCM